MTCDERLEKLLNKAGQTISDLPKGNRNEGAYPGKKVNAMQAVCQFDRMLDVSDIGTLNCLDYILHLTDVIDRLEWALDKTVRERDWLKEMNRLQAGCQTCAHHVDGDPLQCEDGKRLCKLGDDDACVSWEYCGVPEDWRADNGTESDA